MDESDDLRAVGPHAGFVSELLTKAVGQLGLPRPSAVRRRTCGVSADTTARELARAHRAAVDNNEATMLVALAIPFMELEQHQGATPVKPDFGIVCPRETNGKTVGSWLIVGDAKDFERVRARIDDTRLLKGFLQVALAVESAVVWSRLPDDMRVHRWGVLAVPRNAFLQPEAVVELLDDHRTEVRARAEERVEAMARFGGPSFAPSQLPDYLVHLEADFDPQSCATCSLFTYCRNQLRTSTDPTAVLVEIGVEKAMRPAVRGMLDGTGTIGHVPTQVVATVDATVRGLPGWTSRLRTDPVGRPGTINIVLAKSDAAAIGLHGIAVQVVPESGPRPWKRLIFLEPQAPQTRRAVMSLLGEAITGILDDVPAIRLVVPDKPTADLLVSMADSLAGVELSRLRWQRDLDMGRPALTFDGAAATLPEPLTDRDRLAVSFLLEEDRARALGLRSPMVDLRAVLASHMIAGGQAVDSGRLDYLVTWAEATTPLDHRHVSDEIAAERHTPGARLSNIESDLIHAAYRMRAKGTSEYQKLIAAALDYKTDMMDRAIAVLGQIDDSRLLPAYEALEGEAQTVWRRRHSMRASDLVRFSRTHSRWRDSQVAMLDADIRCASQLTALTNPQRAWDWALDAGVRELATAVVRSVDPLRLDLGSRRLTAGSTIALLHVNDEPIVEALSTTLKIQKGSFKLGHFPIGPLTAQPGSATLRWSPVRGAPLKVGDEIVVADVHWFGTPFKSGHELAVHRPSLDTNLAPKAGCEPSSYAQDPAEHRWCCRPHEASEAEWSDTLADRRARGELNPDTWPPLIDEERFDVGSPLPVGTEPTDTVRIPDNLTLDDLG